MQERQKVFRSYACIWEKKKKAVRKRTGHIHIYIYTRGLQPFVLSSKEKKKKETHAYEREGKGGRQGMKTRAEEKEMQSLQKEGKGNRPETDKRTCALSKAHMHVHAKNSN